MIFELFRSNHFCLQMYHVKRAILFLNRVDKFKKLFVLGSQNNRSTDCSRS